MIWLLITHVTAAAAGAGLVLWTLGPRLADADRDLQTAQARLAAATRQLYRLTGHWPDATNEVSDPDDSRRLRR